MYMYKYHTSQYIYIYILESSGALRAPLNLLRYQNGRFYIYAAWSLEASLRRLRRGPWTHQEPARNLSETCQEPTRNIPPTRDLPGTCQGSTRNLPGTRKIT